MIGIVGVLLSTSVLITSVVVALRDVAGRLSPRQVARYPLLLSVGSVFWQGIFAVLSFLVTAILFILVYRFMPKAEVSLRDTLPGAIVGGLLWEIAKYVFAWSVNYFHYDQIYGSVGAVVAVLTWSYVSSLILLFGAQLTAVFHREHPHYPRPDLIRSAMQLSDFDYQLPEELIAQEPLRERDASRMLVVNRQTQNWTDSTFRSFPEHINRNDVVVVNNTRVFPARLIGQRDPTGGRVEVLLVREVEPSIWEALVRPAHRLKPGARVRFGDVLQAKVLDDTSEHGFRRLKFEGDLPLDALIDQLGQTPLPPYIKRPSGDSEDDRVRYQTVFAQVRGAIAAPTAGLHFTPEITEAIRERGAHIAEVTLHVGYGTFEPVRVADIRDHQVASEFFEITAETARLINEARQQGGRVIAVGTTTTRALESSVNDEGLVEPRQR